jgi:osmoprotectant transport system permease protein
LLSAWTLYGRGEGEGAIVIGAKGFSEQYILARLIGGELEQAGYRVEYRDGLGSAVAHNAVASGAVDVLVDYTGTIWTNQMKRTDNPARDSMLEQIATWESGNTGITVLGRLGFENAYGLAMRRETATSGRFETIGDLAERGAGMTIGGDPEFFERPEWIAVRDAYGLRFAQQRNFSPTFMYNALKSGEADVIGAYTSDGRIAADDLVVLEDPEGAFPNYDAIVLLSEDAVGDDALVAALSPLVGAIDVELMREANLAVDRTDGAKMTPAQAAALIAERIGLAGN